MAPYLESTTPTTMTAPIDSNYHPSNHPPFPHSPTYPTPIATNTTAKPHYTSPVSTSPTSISPDTPQSRLAAEEDKRRRNTAASARFRVKKKQREQALERQAKDLADKTKALEEKVGRLETENEWLRGLVIERDGEERLEEGVEGWKSRKRTGAAKEGRKTEA